MDITGFSIRRSRVSTNDSPVLRKFKVQQATNRSVHSGEASVTSRSSPNLLRLAVRGTPTNMRFFQHKALVNIIRRLPLGLNDELLVRSRSLETCAALSPHGTASLRHAQPHSLAPHPSSFSLHNPTSSFNCIKRSHGSLPPPTGLHFNCRHHDLHLPRLGASTNQRPPFRGVRGGSGVADNESTAAPHLLTITNASSFVLLFHFVMRKSGREF